jgi:hypothetical protein
MKNNQLSERVRRILKRRRGVGEIKMFGGLCFTLNGNMCCGTLKNDLVVRVGPRRYDRALAEPHARPMDFTGKPIKGFVFVGPGGTKTDAMLKRWIKRSTDFVSSLPLKVKGSRSRKKS